MLSAIYLSICKLENEAILRDFLSFWTWQYQKRSNSARFPQFPKLTRVKTKQFCETSIKNRKLSAKLTASSQCLLRFFQPMCLKYCACHEKVIPIHTKCCTCHAKSSQQTWRFDAPKCNPSQEISALTSEQLLMNKSLVLRLPRERHLARSMSQACHRFRKCYKTIKFCSLLTRCIIPCACHAKRHLNVQKCSEPLVFFTLLTSTCASCRNDVHFFYITTSKSGPNMMCFVHFDLEVCFASQLRALFRHHNFQKWSEHGALRILTWKRASRHNGVQFFISQPHPPL